MQCGASVLVLCRGPGHLFCKQQCAYISLKQPWRNWFLHAPHLFVLVMRSFFPKSVRLCLWARSSVVSIFRLHLEVLMAPHSSTLAWRILWMEEPGRLLSMGLLRVGHDWAASLSLFSFMHWRRKWQPTPVFLPGESQGWGSLVGCRLWGRTESDVTEVTEQQQKQGKSKKDLVETLS